jgi:hypothetical protein
VPLAAAMTWYPPSRSMSRVTSLTLSSSSTSRIVSGRPAPLWSGGPIDCSDADR